MTVEVPLTRGYVALIDDEDAARVLAFKWFAFVRGREHVYAVRNGRQANGERGTILMHRWITDAPRGVEVDHASRNTLDNRRANLRFATRSQQMANRRSTSQSGYRGVQRNGKGWMARVQVNKRQIHIGTFNTPEEAARAYDARAIAEYGEFAVRNFGQ